MRLAVDASTLVGEALRVRGRQLLAHPGLDLVVAAEAWGETGHELRKRVVLMTERGFLQARPAAELLDAVTSALVDHMTVIPSSVYADRLEDARWRIPRDPEDVPTVALALALDCGIWSVDHDFFGCGLPVWTTETLVRYLEDRTDEEYPAIVTRQDIPR